MKRRILSDNLVRILTLLPSIILVAIFVYGFIGNTDWVSMTDWGQDRAIAITPELSFIGLENYQALFSDFINTRFRQDIVNTFTYMVLILTVTIAIGLITAILLYLVPLYMTLATALKNPAEISLAESWRFPAQPYWQSFADAFDVLGRYFVNSVVLTVSATVLSALIGSLNGYVFAKWRFPGSELVCTLFLLGMYLPYQIILIPLFQTLRTIGLYGGIPGLIVAHVVYGIPITTLIFRNFYGQIPQSILDSAKVDGATFYGIFGRIMIPLSLPGFVVVGIWQFTQIWNEFLWGITLMQKATNPITVGLAQLAGGQAVTWNLPMEGSIIAAAPVVLVYILLGRYFIRGLLGGALKE